jgi:hypothetical protein
MKSWHCFSSIRTFWLTGSSSLLLAVVSLMTPSSALASNPWSRAVGEADELHDSTEDLRNRMHRLYLASPATSLSCSLDELAHQIEEMVKCGADYNQLQWSLQSFQTLEQQVAYAIAADCRIHSDRSIRHYVERIEEDYRDLVRDLSKCQIPVCTTNHRHVSPYPIVLPQPYPQPHYGAKPSLPSPPVVQPWPVAPNHGHGSNWNGTVPKGGPNNNVPQYWQGSTSPHHLDPTNFPRSGAEALPSWSVPSSPPSPRDVADLIGMIIDRSRR